MSPAQYVVFECGCHPAAQIVAPRYDGERHSISFPRWENDEPAPDESHRLVARGGKWELSE